MGVIYTINRAMSIVELKSFTREDEIRDYFLKILGIPLINTYGIDCLSNNILFEFKFNEDLINNYCTLAQAVSYLHILEKHGEKRPSFICLCDNNEVCIYESCLFEDIISNNSLFTTSPSSPSLNLIDEVTKFGLTMYYYIKFDDDIDFNNAISNIKNILKRNKITAEKIKTSNVKRAYDLYVKSLGDYLLNQSRSNGVFEFRADALGKARIVDTSLLNEYTIAFTFSNGANIFNNIPKIGYDTYWKQWKRIYTEKEAKLVFEKIYDLLGMADKRTKGQFYTPKILAETAWSKIEEQLGKDFWLDGTWRIWDCCAGTGNLEYDVIPESAKQYLYLSTLDIEEVDTLLEKFAAPTTVFQFDFLNDYINKKAPRKLRDDMKNENIKFLIFINPPYIESNGKSGIQSGTASSGCQEQMQKLSLGNAAREVYAQFLYKLESYLKKKYFLGLFSNPKFICSKNFEAFRMFWHPEFKGGFAVNASEFFKGAGDWCVLFSMFDCQGGYDPLKMKTWWNSQNFEYEVLNKNTVQIGKKEFCLYNPHRIFRNVFGKSIEHKVKKMPLLKSAINLANNKQYMPPFAPKDFLASMVFISPEFQQQGKCDILSGIANTNHNTIFITETNYKQILTYFAIYKAPQATYLNNKDYFLYPNRELTEEEKTDCILYSLICDGNNCATYQFDNGDFILNKFNPLDPKMFDFSNLSKVGKSALSEVENYLNNIVKYDTLKTSFGIGTFLGLYQYRTTPDKKHKECYGFEYPTSFKDAIENLRKRVEQISKDVCLK